MYDITYKDVERTGSYFIIPITTKVTEDACIGDQIGVHQDGNMLEVDAYVDLDDEDIQDFIREYFQSPRAISGFIRRIKQSY